MCLFKFFVPSGFSKILKKFSIEEENKISMNNILESYVVSFYNDHN